MGFLAGARDASAVSPRVAVIYEAMKSVDPTATWIVQGETTVLLAPFLYQSNRFAKTGSGQT
jgi:hypothetical protein